jgi:hypothetical protein
MPLPAAPKWNLPAFFYSLPSICIAKRGTFLKPSAATKDAEDGGRSPLAGARPVLEPEGLDGAESGTSDQAMLELAAQLRKTVANAPITAHVPLW